MSEIVHVIGKPRKIHPDFNKSQRPDLKGDAVNLDQEVRSAVNLFIASQQAFTTVDVSHPIITKHKVRHGSVREIIQKMLSDGEFENAGYTTSIITVYPSPNTPQSARLFHPDDPNFDPNSYTSTQQELHRNQTPVGRQINVDLDGDTGNDNQVSITATPTGNPVSVQCQIQNIKNTLNIPRMLIKRAGFNSGDHFSVSSTGNAIRIKKETNGAQTVDSEGRIRIYNPNLKHLNKGNGQNVNAVLVSSGSDNYIEIF